MDPLAIMKAYKGLYKIEESFRVLKTNLSTRPVFHFKERRIRAHFLVCYTALVLQRLLEYQLNQQNIKMSTHEIIKGLKAFEISKFHIKKIDIYTITTQVLESKVNTEIFKLKKSDISKDAIEKYIKNNL